MTKNDHYTNLIHATESARTRVLDHRIYSSVTDLPSLRCFMESHVFAVWDFMTLLKSLQRRLTGMELPWRPPALPAAARIINEIVLAEESDERSAGVYISHFEIYVAAMEEVGASTEAVRGLLKNGLHNTAVPEHCRAFLAETFRFAELPVHCSAAAFLIGREDLVPQMFSRMLRHLTETGQLMPGSSFKFYLERHIEIDGDSHGPLARQLLESLCNGDTGLWAEATEAAIKALAARAEFWDATETWIRKSIGR